MLLARYLRTKSHWVIIPKKLTYKEAQLFIFKDKTFQSGSYVVPKIFCHLLQSNSVLCCKIAGWALLKSLAINITRYKKIPRFWILLTLCKFQSLQESLITKTTSYLFEKSFVACIDLYYVIAAQLCTLRNSLFLMPKSLNNLRNSSLHSSKKPLFEKRKNFEEKKSSWYLSRKIAVYLSNIDAIVSFE